MKTQQDHRPTEAGTTTATHEMMTGIVQDEFGPAERVLRLDQIAVPEVGDDEVLVHVRAAGVDRGVWHLVNGLPYLIRLAGYGVRTPKHGVPGLDLAGVVESVGADVTGFAPGDEVFGIGNGSFAEYVAAPAEKLVAKPDGLTFEQAAAVPVSALTALQAVRDHGKVEAGQRVLVVGASGGVGSYAVQIAKAFGADVTGVSSTSKVDLVRRLGADQVIDYTVDDFAETDERYDVILDIGGNRSLKDLRSALTPRGILMIVGGEEGGKWIGGVDRQLRAMVWSPFVGQKLGTFISSENGADLAVIRELIEAGKVTPEIDRTFPLSEAARAITYVDEGRARGKVVITA